MIASHTSKKHVQQRLLYARELPTTPLLRCPRNAHHPQRAPPLTKAEAHAVHALQVGGRVRQPAHADQVGHGLERRAAADLPVHRLGPKRDHALRLRHAVAADVVVAQVGHVQHGRGGQAVGRLVHAQHRGVLILLEGDVHPGARVAAVGADLRLLGLVLDQRGVGHRLHVERVGGDKARHARHARGADVARRARQQRGHVERGPLVCAGRRGRGRGADGRRREGRFVAARGVVVRAGRRHAAAAARVAAAVAPAERGGDRARRVDGERPPRGREHRLEVSDDG